MTATTRLPSKCGLVLVIAALCGVAGLGHGSQLKLVRGGYEDLMIAINPAVQEDPKLIDAIKEMITNASSDLFRATKLYFRNVSILIPASWKTKSIYKRPRSESYGTADVLIEPRDDPTNNAPYTHQFGLCGEPGQYIHLTPAFLLTDLYVEAYGPRGKVFVHEWAHLRWGVYDEYSDHTPFYLHKGKIEFTRCSRAITGAYVMVARNGSASTRHCDTDLDTGLPEKGCVFFPDEVQKESKSIMSFQALDSVKEFCSENQHNRLAPTIHNRLCKAKSTWYIIQQHKDFKNTNANPPVDTATQPSFRLLQPTARVVTLVLDVSGSMDGKVLGVRNIVGGDIGYVIPETQYAEANRLQRMRQASENFIMKILDSGTMIGIVTFSSNAQTSLQLTTITDEASRERIKNHLPSSAQGGTNVCAGVRHGLTVLRALDGDVSGDEIVLLTDGEDSGISSCVNEVQSSQCIVHTIALGPSADPALEKLTTHGGLTFSASDNLDTNSLVDAFSSAKIDDGDASSVVLQLESTGRSLTSGETMQGDIKVDPSVGKNTQFVVTWLSGTVPEMHVFDPDNAEHTKFQIDAAFKTARLSIPGISKAGTWTYKLKNKHVGADSIALSVTSSQASASLPPVEVKVVKPMDSNDKLSAMQVFAEVKQGSSPVVGATVIATIERPQQQPLHLPLLDNGAGADAKKDDGIYSRFFTQYTATGRYSIKVKVVGVNSTARLAPERGSRALYIPGIRKEDGTLQVTQVPPPTVKRELTPVSDFSRVASGGSLQVTVPPGGVRDTFPPCRITDLTAELQDSSSVTLAWTAPGGDGDVGRAARYRIMVSSSFDGALDGTERRSVSGGNVTVGDLDAPATAGAVENFTVTTTRLSPGDELYFCVLALDSSNNEGPLSNVAFVTFIPHATTAAPSTAAPTTTFPTDYSRSVLPPVREPASMALNSATGIATGAVVGVVLIVVMCVAYRVCKERKVGRYTVRMEDVLYQETQDQVQPLKVTTSVAVSTCDDSLCSSAPDASKQEDA